MIRIYNILLLLVFGLTFQIVSGQEQIHISGKVTDSNGLVLNLVHISVPGTHYGTVSGKDGFYLLKLDYQETVKLSFSSLGFQTKLITRQVSPGENLSIHVTLLESQEQLEEVQISESRIEEQGFTRLNMREVKILPSLSGDIEAYIKTLPGVSSSNELSSQYSVRGGNFDENLIYINDIEVYRPFLIRAGKQEGLSVVNSDLVSSVQFSAGGFNASYGDKMASALDIHYRKPLKIGGGFELGLLGANGFFEGISLNNKFSWIVGLRYKSNQYMLNSLDVTGDYKPRFADLQSYLSYTLSNKLSLDFLGNIALNHYNFIPESRRTSFGTLVNSVQLNILFNGQELDKFNTYLGAFSINYRPTEKLMLKLIASAYSTLEYENYDIEGFYSLNELDKELGSENLGDSILNIGIGRFIDHARNSFQAHVMAIHHKGSMLFNSSNLSWGIKLQNERIYDRMNEWKMVDSAGYSIPYTGQTVNLKEIINVNNELNTIRTSGHILYKRNFKLPRSSIETEAGIRGHYWSFNHQFLFSPRISIMLDPEWQKQVKFRFATGIYFQPAFYKEIRNEKGWINENIKAQRSIHFLAGGILDFRAGNRPFRFSTDIYYKDLKFLIPYKIDNVRIIYSGENNAKGYAAGLEFKINGEFVKGVDSWASLSLMQTREKLTDDSGSGKYYPRPTDQLINFSIFFQDYFPSNPTFKVYLALHIGSGLPVTAPGSVSGEDYFRMPPYRRVDLGFSKILKDKDSTVGEKGIFRYFSTAWISLEVFNLLDINNTISYTWITTVNNLSGQVGEFAVPNYLTSRRINLKLTANF
ncbi:MAG: TonB-dependent receptor [Bacteroidota bacterium]|nr:TonB-dependent receptor [Bacteroidota bacterium]